MSMMSVFPGGGTGGGEPGPAGVGIASIEQTTTSTESGGENIITFTRTDGTVDTFSVFNGAQGEQGPAGRDGYEVHNAQVYSTEETVIGQWIDGKPIYKKVFVTTTPSTTTATTIATIDDFDALVTRSGHFISQGGYIFELGEGWAEIAYCVVAISTAGEIRLRAISGHLNRPVIIIVKYTKTTDEATIAIATVAELDAAYSEGVQAA